MIFEEGRLWKYEYGNQTHAPKSILSKLKDSEYLKPEAWRSSRRGIPGGKIALMGTSQKTFKTLSEILARELENRVKSLEIARARVEV